MRYSDLTCVVALLAATSFAADVMLIDDFEYADEAAAQAAWQPDEQAEPVGLYPHESEGGKTALMMPCNFSLERYKLSPNNPRAVYDRTVDLDLARYGSIVFDFYCDDPDPIRNATLYFHSAAGWYAKGFNPSKGWKRMSVSRSEFGREDAPGGWRAIDRIRVCAWQSKAEDTFCAIDNLHARTEDIAIIRGSVEGSESRTARDCAERVGNWLSEFGIRYGSFTDEDVAAGALSSHKLAIFAYNPGMSAEAIAQVIDFIGRGGKVMFFYSIDAELAKLLGVASYTYMGSEHRDQFAEVGFEADAIPGLPEKMQQGSWNINAPEVGGHNAKAIGFWQDKEGNAGPAAVVLSDNGSYMGHILTGSDAAGQSAFTLALVGHFVPEAWQQAAENALTGAKRVGPFTDREQLSEFLSRALETTPFTNEIQAGLDEAAQAEIAAKQALDEGEYVTVMTEASRMRGALAGAYEYAHSPRDGEFRAVWNHSGTGDVGTWDDAMKALADGNFNAVVPNMWWGGIAHYDSKLLPHSKTFEEKGDQIAQAVEAGKKYGIEVHPWKVNWNLSTAPDSFVDQMREEGRLQARANGEEMRWLCPSHPDNFKLEVDTMLEVVRNYDVDGVHFDYIRYPHGDSCYCEGCHERFEKFIGREIDDWPTEVVSGDLKQQYRDWRCDQITRVVKAVAEEAHRIKPHIKISAAVFGSYPAIKNSIGQDWVLWCREGWLDFVCPMDYTQSDSYFTSLVKTQVGYVGGTVPLYTGIGHWRIPDDQAIGQMEISRNNGADGFILFNMGASLAENALPKFAKAITSEKAVLPHNAPDVTFKTQFDNEEPVVEVAEAGLTMEITLSSLGQHRTPADKAQGEIALEDLSGKRIKTLCALPAVGETATVNINRQDGVFRVAATGELSVGDDAQRFIRRSRPYQFSD